MSTKALKVEALAGGPQVGEEAEVYGYSCETDCVRWRDKDDWWTTGCYIEISCYFTCWW